MCLDVCFYGVNQVKPSMNELSMLLDWDTRAYSLESFVDDRRSTLPCVIQTAEGFCAALEEESLENGKILILHDIRQEQFVVVTHPNGAEIFIPLTCPVRVELVPLDRLNDEYNTVEELFMAQPDYFRVLDNMPLFNITSGSVMKICARQTGVYHLECETVGQASRQEIVKLPLTQHGRFQPLHDAREYLLEEVLARFPPPSKIGVRLINNCSIGSPVSISSNTQLPWGSGLRVQRILYDNTIIATTAGEEGKEVLLFPKTLDVSVVPALDSRAKCELLTTIGQTTTFVCLAEKAMKFSSLRAHHRSCRLRIFSFEDVTSLRLNELCEILPNLHESPVAHSKIRTRGEQGSRNNSVNPAFTKEQANQTWYRTPFYPEVQNIAPLRNSVSLQSFPKCKVQLKEKRQGRVGLDSFLKDCALELSDNVPNTKLSLASQENPTESAEARIKVRSKSESTHCELFVSRSRSESDLDRNTSSDEADNKCDNVLSGGPNPVSRSPRLKKRKEHSLRRKAYSGRVNTNMQADYTNETRSTLRLPLGPKSLSESDLYRKLAHGEGNDDDQNPIPLPPRCQKDIGKPMPNPIPLPPRLHKQSHKPVCNSLPLPRRRHKPEPNPIPLPPRLHKLSDNMAASNPIPLPPRFHKGSKNIVSNPIPLPPRGKRPSAGSSVGMEKTLERERELNVRSKSLTSLLDPESLSADKDEDGYSMISDNSLDEDGYSTISRQSMSGGMSSDDDDGYSRISESGLARSLCSDDEQHGYSTISPCASESEFKMYMNDGTPEEYTAVELEKIRSVIQIPETKQWNCGTREPRINRGGSASYCYAYQHFWLHQRMPSEHKSDSYVNRPLLRPRHRQYSDSIAEKMTKQSMKPEENNQEEGMSITQGNKSSLRKKSRSEGDVFRDSFSQMEVRDLEDDYYIELLPDVEPDATYLEPVDAFPGAVKLQGNSPDINCKRVAMGVEGQESHEGRISSGGSQEEDSEESGLSPYSYSYMHIYPFLRGGSVEGISTPMSDGALTQVEDHEEETEKSTRLSSWLHIDDNNEDCPKLPEKLISPSKNVEECSPSVSAEASCAPLVYPRKSCKGTSNGESELVGGTIWGIRPSYREPSQDQEDLCKNTNYPVATEMSKEHPHCSGVGENEAAAKVTKNQELENRRNNSSKTISRTVAEHDGFHERDCEHEFEDIDDIQRHLDMKGKKTFANVKFEAELSRVIRIKAQHASSAKENFVMSTFDRKSSPPFSSTETIPSFDEQSEKHTRDQRPCPKKRKTPVPIPRKLLT